MSVPSDCLAKVPIYMLSPTPTPSPPNEFDSLVSAFSGRSEDEQASASGTDGNCTTTDDETHGHSSGLRHFGERQLRRLHNNNNHRPKSGTKCRRSSSTVSSNSVQMTKAKLMRALTIGGGSNSNKPVVRRNESSSANESTSANVTTPSSNKIIRVTTVMKLCRDCKLLVRHIIDVGHTNYDSTMAATTSRQSKTNSIM